MAEISIVLPVYNTEKFLRRCIDSILNQTFSNFELIIVNDGSPDNSKEIMEEYAKKDKRIITIYKENGGPSDAKNKGIEYSFENSQSQWITFIDSDDCIHPQYLELLYNAVKKDNTQISVCEISRFKSDEEIKELISSTNFNENQENYYNHTKLSSQQLYLNYTKKIVYVGPWAKLYKKSLFSEIRFPKGKLWEDLATTYKFILSVDYCSTVEHPLYYYFVNPEGIIQRKWTPKRLDEFEAYEQQLEFFKPQPKYAEIYKSLQLTYIKAINYSYYLLSNSQLEKKEKKHYKKLLTKKMRKAIKEYDKKLSFNENKGIYDVAHPKLMTIYWNLKRLSKK